MFRRSHVARSVVALVSGGLLTAGPGIGAASAHGGNHGGRHYEYYAASVLTTTDLKVGARSACATVWSDAGRPRGSVTFSIEGEATATASLVNGTVCVKLPRLRPGTYQVTARYNGYGRYLPSSDTAYPTVKKRHGHGYYKQSGYDTRSVAYRPAVSPTAGDLGEWLRQFCWPA